jgi:hypothetical protein
MQSFSERRAEILIRILDVAPMVLTISSIAFALWLIWTEGLSGSTLATMLGASLLGGMLIGLTVLIEERLAARVRARSGRPPEADEAKAGTLEPVRRILAFIVTHKLLFLGVACIGPVVALSLLCGVFADRAAGRCLLNFTNTTAWTLGLIGAAALLVCFVVYDEKLLGMRRLGRLRRNRRARERRRGQRDEDKQAEGVYGALDAGKKRDRTER